MEQARYYICQSCMTPVPTGHKFCGRCGTETQSRIGGYKRSCAACGAELRYFCPVCEAQVGAGDDRCPVCGEVLED